MATERTITCEDCHQPEQTTGWTTIRCHVCRLAKNLAFVRERTAKCWVCSDVFCPIARDDQLCSKCAFAPKSARPIQCIFCEETKTSIAKDLRVCMYCARDKQYRKRFMAAVLKKQADRLSAEVA